MKVRGWPIGRLDALFLAASLCMASLFVALGFWQVRRLEARRARNALVVARLALPPVALTVLSPDTATTQYRTVRVVGTYDFAHEFVFVNRTREGSPGVQLITPLRVAGRDTAVLIDRGWVYSPNAEMVDRGAWRESPSVDTTGYIQELPTPRSGAVALPGRPDVLRWLDPAAIAKVTGYPVAPFYVVLGGDTSAHSFHVPARVPPPPLDEGPHLSYAIQWFSFAVIAVGGAFVAVFGVRRRP